MSDTEQAEIDAAAKLIFDETMVTEAVDTTPNLCSAYCIAAELLARRCAVAERKLAEMTAWAAECERNSKSRCPVCEDNSV